MTNEQKHIENKAYAIFEICSNLWGNTREREELRQIRGELYPLAINNPHWPSLQQRLKAQDLIVWGAKIEAVAACISPDKKRSKELAAIGASFRGMGEKILDKICPLDKAIEEEAARRSNMPIRS